MKIFKKDTQSLVIKCFGIRDTLYLATAVLIYFDLNDPDEPLKEQELWQTIPGELGGGVLDAGMPKTRGEFLVTGSCFAPRGQKRNAAEVSVRAGAVRKVLNVFGDRHWKKLGRMGVAISDPEPFSQMPIVYERAFGGEGFAPNPLGRGFAPLLSPSGQEIHPLPNIEHPARLIGSPSDRPEPAGFGPLDPMWPQRAKKNGTYDDRWMKERWPHFPDDQNYEFFNTAPEDQFLNGFFAAGDSIEIRNMHPDLPVINSRIPRLRIRCFVTKKKSLRAKDSEEEIFQEATTRIDTVWLFPAILRGVAMYRGTTEILDEEYADVVRIFLATERLSDPPKSIEFYYEEQKNFIKSLIPPIDLGPLEAAQKEVAEALKRVKAIPKEIEEAKKRALGQAPILPRTPAEMQAQAQETLRGGLAVVDQTEALAREMHAQYGHLVEIDLKMFDSFRQKIGNITQRVNDAFGRIGDAQKKADEILQKGREQFKSLPSDLRLKELDPDEMLSSKVNPWHDRGFPLVVQWRKALEKDAEARNALLHMGFQSRTIDRAWLGINRLKYLDEPPAWGLPPAKDGRPMIIPPGLVMPRFKGAVLGSIRVRPNDYSLPGQDVTVEGSASMPPLFLPAISTGAPPVLRVADELEAWLMEQEAGDAVSVIALKDPGEKPEKEDEKALQEAPVLLVALPPGADEEWPAWSKAFPNARKLPLPDGQNVFEARRQGTDLRGWVLAALPESISRQHQVEFELPEKGKPPKGSPVAGLSVPIFDVKALVEKVTREIKEGLQPKIDKLLAQKKEMEALQKEMEEKAKEGIRRLGKDPQAVLAEAQKKKPLSIAEAGDEFAKRLEAHREGLKNQRLYSPEADVKLKETAQQISQMAREGQARYDEGMAKLAAAREEIAKAKAGQIPDSIKATLEAAGVDPERIRKLTREEVIERYQRGESLARRMLNDLDLSGLDLKGIDLTEAHCQKTKFTGSNLDGADLTQTLAQEADFTEASLKGMKSARGLFVGAFFKKAVLSTAQFEMAVLQKADLSGADGQGARFKMCILQEARFTGGNFAGAEAEMCILAEADLTEACLRGFRFEKCVFQKAILDRADFSGAVLNSTMLYESRGEGVKFTGADLTKGRMGGGTSLPGADFQNAKLVQACLRESNLSGADFRGSRIESSMLEDCDLSKADFYRVPAKGTRFSRCNLDGANLKGVNLLLGSLRKSRLVQADLRGSNLYGVDFYKAVVGETNFEGANLKMTQLHRRTDLLEKNRKS